MKLPFLHSASSYISFAPDMEALLQQQLSEPPDMARNSSESISSSEGSDVLMIDRPFLDYINQILMEDGMDDATPMPQVDNASYQAIFSGFYDILGEDLPPNLHVNSPSREAVFDSHVQHQSINFYHEKGLDEQHVKVVNPNSREGVFVMASHTPLQFTPISAKLHGMKNDMYNSGSHLNSTGSNEASVSLSSKTDTMAQNAIKLNDGALMDVMVPCWAKDAVGKGLSDRRCMGRLEEGFGNLKPPSLVDGEFSAKLAEVDLSFEDLELNAVYTDLYVGEPSSLGSSTRAAHTGDKKKSLAVASNDSKSGQKRASEVSMFVDVREVLVSCAQAVAIGDARRANKILQELRQVHGASANGTGLQRTAHYFSEALAVRLRGMGEQHLRAISHNMPSAAMILRALKLDFEVSPFMKVMHYFANQSILKAAEGASRLHVVDYGLMFGMQWPCLINALADCKGGPPLLVITGIEFPHPGINMAERLEQSGRRLAAYARTYGVPFQYHAVVTSKWEDLDTASLHLHEGEILVVNCLKRLRHLADEVTDSASTISPRQKFFTHTHSLNPHLLVTSVLNAAYNSPFFVSRFREALYCHSNFFDILDTLWGDTPQRRIIEQRFCYRNIINVVACEGAERVDRPETYRKWHARITKAGFEQLPIPPTILSTSKSHVKQHHHKDFLIHDDANGWMLMGWKGRIMFAISAWKPNHV